METLTGRSRYARDFDLGEAQFRAMLAGELSPGRLDQRWAAIHLLDYGSWMDIWQLIGFRLLLEK